MTYTDTLAMLAASTEESVVALYERFLAGELTEAEMYHHKGCGCTQRPVED